MKKKLKKTITLLNSINYFILEKNLFKPHQQILIGISGGQDSICLLFVCYILQKQWTLDILMLYCQHLWQKETFFTYCQLSKLAWILKINFSYSITIDLILSEQTARNWRFYSYFRLLNFLNSKILLTGHTKSDQIETFFFNLMRGTGIKGSFSLKDKRLVKNYNLNNFNISKMSVLRFKTLKKKAKQELLLSNNSIRIQSKNKVIFKKLVSIQKKTIFNLQKKEFVFSNQKNTLFFFSRPLLNQSRFDIQKMCNFWNLPILPDKSNKKSLYTRNRIRQQLLPSLRFFFNPQIESNLSKYHILVSEEDRFIENLVKNIFQEFVTKNGKFFCLNISLLKSFPIGLQRKLCVKFFGKDLSKRLTFYTIDLFIQIVTEKSQELTETTSKWFFVPKIGILFIFKKTIFVIQ